jgi:hypothetical protein
MKKQAISGNVKISSKKSNPGVHAKSKTSSNKNSKNYKKLYKGQGK